MASLGVNIDHIANVRQARRTVEPDPVSYAILAELGGADGITVHLREDRRHIQDRDVEMLRQVVRSRLNLEMAATAEMEAIALRIKPDMVTLVPEKREEVTTEGGLDVAGQLSSIKGLSGRLQDAGIGVSLFVDAEPAQLEACQASGARWVELHTGTYAEANWQQQAKELARITEGTFIARSLGLRVNAGHGLLQAHRQGPSHDGVADVELLHPFDGGDRLNVLIGEAVRQMKALVQNPRREPLFGSTSS